MKSRRDYLTALNTPDTPVLFLDREALDQNINWIKNHHNGKAIRLATKSIRSIEVLRYILQKGAPFKGLMTYDLREALWLRSLGFTDLLMGYPTTGEAALRELAINPSEITLMVDRVEHLEMIEKIFAQSGKTAEVCLDADMSMDLPGLRFGVFRSQLSNLDRLSDFLERLKTFRHIRLTGLMGYEAQIAGVMDKESLLIRTLKKLSIAQLRKRRSLMVDFIQKNGFKLTLINGGGTGSLTSTNQESVVTEVTVGSGLYAPVLFDHYQDFQLSPALFFTLPVVRNPEKKIYTCLGGGYIASGSTDSIKQPQPYLPVGARLLKHEGAGEVQTPVHYEGPEKITIGDSIIFRHAKAGEICERFTDMHIIFHGKLEQTVKTYRGEGKTFL